MRKVIDIETLRNCLTNKRIKWTQHCLERMQERDIFRADIKNCVMYGEIIEDYPNDFPHPSCLIFGHSVDNKVIHVVAGTDAEYIYFITAYACVLIRQPANTGPKRPKNKITAITLRETPPIETRGGVSGW